MGFAPLDLVDVSVGRSSIKLYPRLTASMPVYERAHAFQVNKTALTNAQGIEISQIHDAFGAQMNSSSTVKGLISIWRQYFQEQWMDFTHLAILSFHQSNGNRIDDTTVAGSPEVLLPIIDGSAAACRKPDIKFVRVRCTINFAGLVSVNPYPVHPILRVDYYIKLPQTIQGVRRGATDINIETFCGAADLRTLSTAAVWVLLDQIQQDAPVLLKASNFNLQATNTDSINLAAKIDRRILKLVWHQICASLFTKVCTGYTSQPQAAFNHIKQCYIDSDGNQVCVSVFTYYQRMMNAMRPFAGDVTFPKSICNALIDRMSPDLLRVFRKHYPDHSLLHDTSSTFQFSQFKPILDAMTAAEEEVANITAIARQSVGGQAFAASVPTFASQAERTLDRFAPGGYSLEGGYCLDGGRLESSRGSRGELGRGDKCFGCGGPHPYIKNKVVVCPNKDKPGVKEAADTNYREWVEKRKKQNKKRKERSVSYDKLSDKDKAKMRESVLASLCVSSVNDEALMITADSSHRSPPAKKPHMTILVVDIAVLSSASPLKSILPALIITNFPHIHLQLGSTLDDPACPVIRCVVDNAAALTTGNFHFVAAIAKRYPHTVAKIFVPEDYNPIVLSGIVQRGGESITTKLTVGFQFHLPYLMTDGSQTSILIATGPHVTVNIIVGLPFIQATRAIIDLSDDVVDLCAIDHPPFPIEYRRATVHVPTIKEGADRPVHLTEAKSKVIQTLENLEAYFSSAELNSADGSTDRHVSFGSVPGKRFPTLQTALSQASKLGVRGFVGDPMEHYCDPELGPDNALVISRQSRRALWSTLRSRASLYVDSLFYIVEELWGSNYDNYKPTASNSLFII
jgi:hypothetical protein